MAEPSPPEPPRFQFTTIRLLLVMAVTAVSTAVMGALLRLKPDEQTGALAADERMPLVLMLVAAPLGVMILASLLAAVFQPRR